MRKVIASVLVMILVATSASITSGQEADEKPPECELQFDGILANESVHFQTSLGPRIPGSNASFELRESLKSNLSGWEITEKNHYINGMNLTNLFATWNPEAGSEVILAAHYDTRHKADQDPNESRQDEPILGANDGASGVAVLIELARHIPEMNLSHSVTLFFTDAEDQGDDHSTYIIGARAWADNLSAEEADKIESFVLVDMVGDSDLNLRKTYPGNVTLWNRTENIIRNIDSVCEINESSYFDFEKKDGIYDDHVPAIEKGIPAIDIIDTRYGEGAEYLGGYWHTHEDTADKVSAESLEKVGLILEYGLRTGAWLNVRVNEETNIDSDGDGIIDLDDDCIDTWGEDEFGCPTDEIENKTEENNDIELYVRVAIICSIALVMMIFVRLVYADNKGEG